MKDIAVTKFTINEEMKENYHKNKEKKKISLKNKRIWKKPVQKFSEEEK